MLTEPVVGGSEIPVAVVLLGNGEGQLGQPVAAGQPFGITLDDHVESFDVFTPVVTATAVEWLQFIAETEFQQEKCEEGPAGIPFRGS
jgi:hypothetical protein